MAHFYLGGGPVAGSSATFTRYLGTPTRSCTPRAGYLMADTTISADGTNYWTFDIQAGGTSVLESTGTIATSSTALTGGTARAFTFDTAKLVTAGQALTLVATKSASGADQSSTLFTVAVEFGD